MTAVRSILRPRSVAIVGASDRSRWSVAAFENLAGHGFEGPIHLVNRRGGVVHGRTAVASCAELPPVDLGVVLVPAEAAEGAVRELAASGAGAVAMLTSGFAEVGPEGAALQAAVAGAARSAGVRLLGPNTLGFLNFADGVRVWTTPVPTPRQSPVRPGGVALISQSGATAFFLTGLAERMGVGLSFVVSTGNEADLDSASFVEELAGDDGTRAIALFIETVRDPARFLRAVAAARAAGKPVVVLKVGRSEVTARAALAHTGALVGDDRVFDGLCRQHGLIRVATIEDLVATADLAARAGRLRRVDGQVGGRVGGLGLVTNSGGICEVAADTAAARGIGLPEFTPGAVAALRDALPAFATAHNPLDVTGGVSPEACGTVARVMGAEPGVAALLCPWYDVPTEPEQANERLLNIYRHMAGALAAAPVPGFFVSYTAAGMNALSHDIVARTGLPYLACGLDRALTAMAGLMWWSGQEAVERPALPRPGATAGARPDTERGALEHLAGFGVPIVPAGLAADADAAVRLAEATGGAVVLKVSSPDIGHKSDVGGVKLNVAGEAAVRAGFAEVMAAAGRGVPGARLDGVLVSPMRARGVELFAGVTRDAQWGPVLAVGLGGVWVEVLKDVALLLLPVCAAEVRAALEGLRGVALLRGSRGVPAADMDRVAAVVARIGDAALALGPGLAALEVNPLWVRGGEVEALDALCVWDAEQGGA